MKDYDLVLKFRLRHGLTRSGAAPLVGLDVLGVREVERGMVDLTEAQRQRLEEGLAGDGPLFRPRGMRPSIFHGLKWRWSSGLDRQQAADLLGMDLVHYYDAEMNGKLWRILLRRPGRT